MYRLMYIMKKQSQEYNSETIYIPHILFCFVRLVFIETTNSNKYEFNTVKYYQLCFTLYI